MFGNGSGTEKGWYTPGQGPEFRDYHAKLKALVPYLAGIAGTEQAAAEPIPRSTSGNDGVRGVLEAQALGSLMF